MNATPIPDGYWEFSRNLSPDRMWDVKIDYPFAVTVTSTKTKTILRDSAPQIIPYTSGPMRNAYVNTWFPDSSGFVLYDADTGCEKCSFDRLIIYRLDISQRKMQRYVLEPMVERNTAFWTDVSISPDGSQFAVVVNDREIYIVNRKAEVIRKIMPEPGQGDRLDWVDWTQYGLLYEISSDQIGNDNPGNFDLRMIDMTNQTRPDVLLLHTIGWGLYVESVDPFSPRLVLYDYLPAEVPDVWSEDIIFNIQSRQFEDILCTNREEVPACDIVNAGDQHLFTMRMGEQGENLYVFNWLTRQLIDKKYHIEKIIEWRQDLQSFIVQQGEYPDDWLESIKP
jgi:hypothetical protein